MTNDSTSSPKKRVRCPQCEKLTEYSAENPYRPFCSHRCQLIDLGDWASEKYAVPAEDQTPPEDNTADQNKMNEGSE